MISLSGEWVLIFRFASTHTSASFAATDTWNFFFSCVDFFSFPHKCTPSLEAGHRTVKREQISTTKHLFIFCVSPQNRLRNRFSYGATTRPNYSARLGLKVQLSSRTLPVATLMSWGGPVAKLPQRNRQNLLPTWTRLLLELVACAARFWTKVQPGSTGA